MSNARFPGGQLMGHRAQGNVSGFFGQSRRMLHVSFSNDQPPHRVQGRLMGSMFHISLIHDQTPTEFLLPIPQAPTGTCYAPTEAGGVHPTTRRSLAMHGSRDARVPTRVPQKPFGAGPGGAGRGGVYAFGYCCFALPRPQTPLASIVLHHHPGHPK